MCPPPFVIGDGSLAVELVRRLVVGWQQFGERMVVHCVGRELGWVDDAEAGLEHLADLRRHPVCNRGEAQLSRFAEIVGQWREPVEREGSGTGPSVYVALASDRRAGVIGEKVAHAFPSSRVVVTVNGDPTAWAPLDSETGNLTVLSSLEMMTDPVALTRTHAQLLR